MISVDGDVFDTLGIIAEVDGESRDVLVIPDVEVGSRLVVIVPPGQTPTLALPNPIKKHQTDVVVLHNGTEVEKYEDIAPHAIVGVLSEQLVPESGQRGYYHGDVTFSFRPRINREDFESALEVAERHIEQCFALTGTVDDPAAGAKVFIAAHFHEGIYDSVDVTITYLNELYLAKLRNDFAAAIAPLISELHEL
ncbi:MAG: hypothetical protein HZC02_01680 [Candidatus Levybacteria bacterium]|nr:hypothetical protein [Candidatus Levybacteria bacterium]